MSGLRAPHLGPIVGHTTERSCRLWIRAEDPADRQVELADERRTIGVVAILQVGGKAIPVAKRPIYYFRLRREYDRTGTFNLGIDSSLGSKDKSQSLTPDTEYRVRLATFALDDPLPNDIDTDDGRLAEKLPPPSVWGEEFDGLSATKCEAVFRTFGDPNTIQPQLGFLLGSCRYPGVLWQKREADQIFAPMLSHARNKYAPAKFVLMVGDQIYADLLNRMVPIGRADSFQEFQERYHTAFSSTNMRSLLRHLTTYMILDDHEIEDNWTQDRIKRTGSRQLFMQAIRAYQSYQWSHGPRNFGSHLYYHFNCDGYPFFVLDTRTQRYVDDISESLLDNHLLGRPSHDPVDEPGQLDFLKHWLSNQQSVWGNVPKFICSSSVFVPNSVDSTKSDKHKLREDSWSAFPDTRRRLLEHIVGEKIQNVIFLSGDIHCSNVTTLNFSGVSGSSQLRAFSITSSAFYWPFPFADGDPASYVHDSYLEGDTFNFFGDNGAMNYQATNFTQEDNFCRIDLDQNAGTLTVKVFDWRGEPVRRRDGQNIVSTLALAKW